MEGNMIDKPLSKEEIAADKRSTLGVARDFMQGFNTFQGLILFNKRNFNRLKSYLAQYYCGFVSASRYDNSPEENDKLTSDLKDKLRGLRFGYIEVEGMWEETGVRAENEVPDENTDYDRSSERTLMFFNKNSGRSTDKFIKLCGELCAAYKQRAVMVSVPLAQEREQSDINGDKLIPGHGYYYNESGKQFADLGMFNEALIDKWMYDKDKGSFGRGRMIWQ